MSLDPLKRQILWSRLIAVVEEQSRTLMKVAFSPTVREAGDLSAGLFDAHGRMVAQAVTGTPGHVNAMAVAARHFLAVYPPATMQEGDHYITNDPWLVSGHLHDVTVLSPVFRRGRPVAFFACTCHQVDIGGLGMGPDGRSVFEEGLYLPILPLARAGELNHDLIRLIRANVRTPDEAEGDILAYVTANETSAQRLNAMLDEFGLDDIEALAGDILTISETGMRDAIRALPDGTWRNEMRLDGFDSPVDLRVAFTIAGDEIAIDFAGTSTASPRGINLVLNYTRAYASYGVRAAIAPDVPNNEGSLAPVHVDAPVGSILNVEKPAPVWRGTSSVSSCRSWCLAVSPRCCPIWCRPKALRAIGVCNSAAVPRAGHSTSCSSTPAVPVRGQYATDFPPQASRAESGRSPSRSVRRPHPL